MAVYVTALNVTDQPVLIDFEGRQLGGGDWGVVDRSDPSVKAAVEADRLVVAPIDADVDDIHPDAKVAAELASHLEERRTAFSATPVVELRKIAVDNQVVPPDAIGEVTEAELVRMLTRRTAIPGPTPKRTRS